MPAHGKAEPCCFSDFEHASRCHFQVVRSPIRNVMRNIQAAATKDAPARSQSCQQPTSLTRMRPPPRVASNENRPPSQQWSNGSQPPMHRKPAAENHQDAAKKVHMRSPLLSPRGPPPAASVKERPENPRRPTFSQEGPSGDQYLQDRAGTTHSENANQLHSQDRPPATGSHYHPEKVQEASLIAHLRSKADAEASRAAELQGEVFQCAQAVNSAKQRAAIAERKVQYLEMNLNALEASVETNRQDAVSKTIQAHEQAQDLEDAQAELDFRLKEIQTLVSGHEHMQQQLELQKQEADADKRTLQAIKESVALCEHGTSGLDLTRGLQGQDDTTLQLQQRESAQQLELCIEEERQKHAAHVEELLHQNAVQLRNSQSASHQLVEELRRQLTDINSAKTAVEEEARQQMKELQQVQEAQSEALRCEDDTLKAKLLRVEAAEDACQERSEILQEKEAMLKECRDEELCHLESCMAEQSQQHAAHVAELQQQIATQTDEQAKELKQQLADAKEQLQQCTNLREQLHEQNEELRAAQESSQQALSDEAAMCEARFEQNREVHSEQLLNLSESRAAMEEELKNQLLAKHQELEMLQDAHADAVRCQDETLKVKLLRVEAAEDACQERSDILREKEAMLKQCKDEELCHLELRMAEQAQQHVAHVAELQQKSNAQMNELHEQIVELQQCRESCQAAEESSQEALSDQAATWEARLEQQREVHSEQVLKLSEAREAMEEDLNNQLLAKHQELQLLTDAHADAVKCQDESLKAKLLRLEAAEDACKERSQILEEKELLFKQCKEEAAAIREECHELEARQAAMREDCQKLEAREEEAINAERQANITVEELRLSHHRMEEAISQLEEEKQKELSSQTQDAIQQSAQVQSLEAEIQLLRVEKEQIHTEMAAVESRAQQAEQTSHATVEDHQQKIEIQSAEMRQLVQERDEALEKGAQAEAAREQASASKDDMQREQSETLERLEDEKMERDALVQKHQEATDHLHELEEGIKELEAQRDLALRDVEDERQKAVHAAQASQARLEDLTQQYESEKAEKEEWSKKHAAALEQMSQSEGEQLKVQEDVIRKLEAEQTSKEQLTQEKEAALERAAIAEKERDEINTVREETMQELKEQQERLRKAEEIHTESVKDHGCRLEEESAAKAKLMQDLNAALARAAAAEEASEKMATDKAEVEHDLEEVKKERDSMAAQLEECTQERNSIEAKLTARISALESDHAAQESAMNEAWQKRLDQLHDSSQTVQTDLKEDCDSKVSELEEQVRQLISRVSGMESQHACQLSEQEGALNESWQRRLAEVEQSKEELKKERDCAVTQLEERVNELLTRIRNMESNHASQMAIWQQQQDQARAGELEDFRNQCKELMETVNQFMPRQESLMMENKSLKESLALFEDDLERVSDRHAQLIGHVNPKQKIRYTLKLKDEKNELRTELSKTRSRLAQLECARRSESLFEALASLGYGSVHGPIGASPPPMSVRRQQHLTPTRISLASPEHSITSRTPRRSVRTVRGGASVGGESDAGDDRLYMAQRQCQMQERTLERLTTDFQHIVSLIERAVVADEASAGSAGRSGGHNFALLLQRLRSLSAPLQQVKVDTGSVQPSAGEDDAVAPGAPNTPLAKKALWSPRGEPPEEDHPGHEPEAESQVTGAADEQAE